MGTLPASPAEMKQNLVKYSEGLCWSFQMQISKISILHDSTSHWATHLLRALASQIFAWHVCQDVLRLPSPARFPRENERNSQTWWHDDTQCTCILRAGPGNISSKWKVEQNQRQVDVWANPLTMWSWYVGNVPSFSWQCHLLCFLNQVFQYLRRPLLKHQLRELASCVFHSSRAFRRLKAAFWRRVGAGISSLGRDGLRRNGLKGAKQQKEGFEKKRTYESGGMHWSWQPIQPIHQYIPQ